MICLAYFLQDDIVTGSLTVRENLSFSAFLRLPSHMTTKERKDRVQQVINDLRLNGCADRKVNLNHTINPFKNIRNAK